MAEDYVWLDEMPKKEIEKHLLSILYEVERQIVIGYDEGIFVPAKMTPKDVIVMIATNIIVNFMGKALEINSTTQADVKSRIKLMEDCLDEVKRTSMQLWKTIEAARADNSNPN